MYSELHEILLILTYCIDLRALKLIKFQLSIKLIKVYYVFFIP